MTRKKIDIIPETQTGHNCKTVAVATVDRFYGKLLGFKPIPLHKEKVHSISMREIAKKNGSVQGELLELRIIQKVLKDIGYESNVVDYSNDEALFKQTIIQNINEDNLMIVFFNMDPISANPSSLAVESREHGAVVNGFDEQYNEVDILHWNKERPTTFTALYQSSMILTDQRHPEYYKNVKEQKPKMKYDLGKPTDEGIKKSITPAPSTGFKGKLIVIKKPQLEDVLQAREKLLLGKFRGRLIGDLTKMKVTFQGSITNPRFEFNKKKSTSKEENQEPETGEPNPSKKTS